MNSKLDKNQIERYSRQIILKNIGALGQKKLSNQKSLLLVWEA
jgi:adenylyltransferase/sulfurtransferase